MVSLKDSRQLHGSAAQMLPIQGKVITTFLGIKSVTRMVTEDVSDALGFFCSKANPLKIWNKGSLLIKVIWKAGGHGEGVVSTRE